ncbi:DNA-binding response regulator [Altererythrobacter sp. B11]|uniref:response regulator transcription factor n=1 Tax=Altererythrobacter sp. B11 TaxID=2060312 RepID=UPI000DC6F8C5|nr:DNA-binding response regulator [Altererythrobacter sp. B11]BBC73953.1 DNA-binding response regulator [Altererythrobacter sp. B11]
MATDAPEGDRILVVDDTPESLRFLVDTLEREGMTVLIARSGEQAIELLRHVTPDLILMDAVMPGLGGLEATQRIKRDPASADIPVIFMTGLAEPEHAVAAFQSGSVDYVRKPIVIDELLARIRVHLANARLSLRSRLALDEAGRHLVALDAEGALLWCTPRAQALLAKADPAWSPDSGQLPEPLRLPARQLVSDDAPSGASARIPLADCEIELTPLENGRPGEHLIRLSEICEGAAVALLQKQNGLTPREAEVLLWVSYGKSNRMISEILGISPRTVNKHLEQVFRKLGVETRAAAAAIAARAVSDG